MVLKYLITGMLVFYFIVIQIPVLAMKFENYEFFIKDGKKIPIVSVTLHGFEMPRAVPFGLSTHNYQAIINQLERSGYNALEIPWSDDLFVKNHMRTYDIDYTKNGDLKNLTSISILGKIIEYAKMKNLYIIFDYQGENKKEKNRGLRHHFKEYSANLLKSAKE